MAMRMPDELVARARALAERGDWAVPPARPAATVVLVRDGTAGLEVLLMRRPATMRFAPGMHVFPGGRVDLSQDSRPTVRGSLPEGEWAPEPAVAAAIAVAGVRETFEEAGVLIALDRAGRPPLPDGTWANDRARSETPGGFATVLGRRKLHVDADLLAPVAHWVTPEVESLRFDTRFLLAALPGGQQVEAHATEIDGADWIAPKAALAALAAGRMPMLPPTVAVLQDLTGHRSVTRALEWARGRRIVPVMPRARLVADALEWVLVHAYTGAVLAEAAEPAGSEERGTR